jgi:hypothetical protein
MRELEDKIINLEIRAEQFLLHLECLPEKSAEAQAYRGKLEEMLSELEHCKNERLLLAHGVRATIRV